MSVTRLALTVVAMMVGLTTSACGPQAGPDPTSSGHPVIEPNAADLVAKAKSGLPEKLTFEFAGKAGGMTAEGRGLRDGGTTYLNYQIGGAATKSVDFESVMDKAGTWQRMVGSPEFAFLTSTHPDLFAFPPDPAKGSLKGPEKLNDQVVYQVTYPGAFLAQAGPESATTTLWISESGDLLQIVRQLLDEFLKITIRRPGTAVTASTRPTARPSPRPSAQPSASPKPDCTPYGKDYSDWGWHIYINQCDIEPIARVLESSLPCERVQGFVRNLCDVVNTLLRLGGGPYATALRNVNRECGNKGAYVQLVVFLIPVVHRVSPC